MEHVRLLLAIVLTIMIFVLWEFLFVPQRPDDEARKTSEQTQTGQQDQEQKEDDRAGGRTSESSQSDRQQEPEAEPLEVPSRAFKSITVENSLYRAEFSEKGAALKKFVLKNYRESTEDGAPPRVLVPGENQAGTALVRSVAPGLDDAASAVFTTDSDSDSLTVKQGPETLSFFLETDAGLVLEKRFTFYPDTYKIELSTRIVNRSKDRFPSDLFVEMTNPPPEGRTFVFKGPFAHINGDLEEIDIGDIDDKNSYSGTIKWAGIEDRYFMTALVPADQADSEMRLSLDSSPELVRVSYLQQGGTLDPGEDKEFEFELFMGPKRMSDLKEFGRDLDKAIHFGFFDIISKPCLWLMNKIYQNIVPNYGVAIILLTILFKILFWPLGTKSYRSMAEMKKLQPLMTEIRNKYKDDKKKMNEEVMRLYKTYKVNPMSGCLPMVVQIPVFIAFYRMLYEAIELRHAHFMLWINDLSTPDRLFNFDVTIPFMAPPYGIPVLTIIMGATMFLQQKLSPPPGDPAQAKIMMLMPLIFTFIFINFPAGLVLYWLTNNIISIGQQYYVTRKIV